jgi:outer membrane protein assembly factor BamB/actin-like ATPase involved in cell morphogenesis
MVEYGLGVDLGTTHTAAAINEGGAVEAVRLGGRRAEIPSLVFLRADGEVLVGEAAQRRGEAEPTRLAREFKRRLGDPVPVLLGGTPMSAHALTARLLRHVTDTVARGQEAPPARIVLTHPANWGPYKRELLRQAAQLADLPQVTLRTEPEAAAVRYAGTARVAAGETIAVYDLGGGTFDAAVLRKTVDGFEVLGEPQGVEQLGGIDFDEAILEHVRSTLGEQLALTDADLAEPAVKEALARLRRECVEAKESLSFDTEVEIPVALPRLHTRVRLGRAEFEAMIAPALDDTVAALRRALRSAGVGAEQLRCVVLAGGSARIPLVGSIVSAAFGRPVAVDEQPEMGIALGAARLSGPAVDPSARPGPRPQSPAAGGPHHAGAGFAAGVAAASAPPGSSGGFGAAPAGSSGGLPAGTAGGFAGAPPGFGPPGAVKSARSRLRAYRWPVIGGFAAVLLTVTAVAAAAAWSDGDDEGNKPGGGAPPGGNASSAAVGTAAALVWRADTGVPATEPPAVTAARILVGGRDGVLRAFRRADGKLDWELKVGDGLRVADQVPGGVAYATTAAGRVVAVDVERGEQLWWRDTGGAIESRPAVSGDRIFAGGSGAVLHAYQIGGNHRRWRVWADAEILRAPAVSGETAVVAGGDGRLYGMNGSGDRLWTRSVGRIVAGPVAADDAACVVVEGRTVRCLRAEDGEPLSTIKFPDVAPVEIIGAGGAIVVSAADRSVTAWDTHGGGLRWRHRPAGGAAQSGFPAVLADEVAVAYPDGRIAGIDAGLGAALWQYAAADRFSVAPRGDVAGLFAVGDSGTLYALKPPGSSAVVPAPSPGVTYASPSPTATPQRTSTRTRTTRPTGDTTTTRPTTRPPTSTPPPTEPTTQATTPGVLCTDCDTRQR